MSMDSLLLKVVLLLRIDLFARSSDVPRIFRSRLLWQAGRVGVRVFRPKEWRANSARTNGNFTEPVWIARLPKNAALCTVATLELWIARSVSLVREIKVFGRTEVPLCCEVKGPSRGSRLTARRVAEMSLTAMRMAGVPDAYPARSIRSAAASACRDYGVNEKDILRQGRWADVALFNKYYYRSIEREKLKPKGSRQERLRTGIIDFAFNRFICTSSLLFIKRMKKGERRRTVEEKEGGT